MVDREPLNQTRLGSFIEACLNVGSGYLIALGTQVVVFPLFGFKTTVADNLVIAAIFTAVSIVRTYAWRRFFNWMHGKK